MVHRIAGHHVARIPRSGSGPTTDATGAGPGVRQHGRLGDGFDTTGGIPHVSQAGHGVYAPGQRRPRIEITSPVPVLMNGEGQPTEPITGQWAVSAVSGDRVVLYNTQKDGDFRVVSKKDLLASATTAKEKHALAKALHARSLAETTRTPAGTAFVAHPNDVASRGRIPWVPPGGSSTSITGRGTPPLLWGVSTPNGLQTSGTGYVALPLQEGQRFIVTGQTRGERWNYRAPDGTEDPNRQAEVTWALGYVEEAPGHWVKQWVVESIVPLTPDPATPAIYPLTQG